MSGRGYDGVLPPIAPASGYATVVLDGGEAALPAPSALPDEKAPSAPLSGLPAPIELTSATLSVSREVLMAQILPVVRDIVEPLAAELNELSATVEQQDESIHGLRTIVRSQDAIISELRKAELAHRERIAALEAAVGRTGGDIASAVATSRAEIDADVSKKVTGLEAVLATKADGAEVSKELKSLSDAKADAADVRTALAQKSDWFSADVQVTGHPEQAFPLVFWLPTAAKAAVYEIRVTRSDSGFSGCLHLRTRSTAGVGMQLHSVEMHGFDQRAVVAKVEVQGSNGSFLCIWLRGGGDSGAVYHLEGNHPSIPAGDFTVQYDASAVSHGSAAVSVAPVNAFELPEIVGTTNLRIPAGYEFRGGKFALLPSAPVTPAVSPGKRPNGYTPVVASPAK